MTDDILELNKESLTWKEVGKMKTKRGWHKGSAIDLTTQLLSHCTTSTVGNWGSWGAWTACSESCGPGSRSRSRECNNPAPSHGGEECQGSSKESGECNTKPCQGKQKSSPLYAESWAVGTAGLTMGLHCLLRRN